MRYIYGKIFIVKEIEKIPFIEIDCINKAKENVLCEALRIGVKKSVYREVFSEWRQKTVMTNSALRIAEKSYTGAVVYMRIREKLHFLINGLKCICNLLKK